jgi:hypothetical protein
MFIFGPSQGISSADTTISRQRLADRELGSDRTICGVTALSLYTYDYSRQSVAFPHGSLAPGASSIERFARRWLSCACND